MVNGRVPAKKDDGRTTKWSYKGPFFIFELRNRKNCKLYIEKSYWKPWNPGSVAANRNVLFSSLPALLIMIASKPVAVTYSFEDLKCLQTYLLNILKFLIIKYQLYIK